MDIKESNKVIAEFMEIPKCDRCEDCGSFKFGSGMYLHPEEMDYHADWSTLMPVWFKIADICSKNCRTDLINDRWKAFATIIGNGILYYGNDPIKAFGEIVNFIQWYNSQNLNNGKE